MTSRARLLAILLALPATSSCLSVSDPVATGGGAGTGAHSGSGGSTATGGSFPGTGGGSGAENCLNGKDDDGDKLVDCADPDCAPGYECVDVPGGWQAVLTATTGWSASLPNPAACAGGSTPIRYFQGPAGAAACASCSCDAPSGTCGDTPLSCAMGNTACTGASTVNPNNCMNFAPPANQQISCRLGQTPLSSGGCTPSTTALSNPDPWKSVSDACTLGGGGCGASQACVPKQSSSGPTCIAIAGTATCPTNWPTHGDAYTGGNDTRACSDCTCAPDNVSCDPDKFYLMTMADCVDFGPFPEFSGTTCTSYTPTSGTTWSIQRVPAASKQPSGSCTAAGGVPSGSLVPTGQTTLCCR